MTWHIVFSNRTGFFNSSVEAVLDKILDHYLTIRQKMAAPLIVEYAANEKWFYRARVFNLQRRLKKR